MKVVFGDETGELLCLPVEKLEAITYEAAKIKISFETTITKAMRIVYASVDYNERIYFMRLNDIRVVSGDSVNVSFRLDQ